MAMKMEDLVRARHRQLVQSGVDPSEAIEALIAEVSDGYSKAGGANMAEVEKFGAGVREYFGGLSAEELAAEPGWSYLSPVRPGVRKLPMRSKLSARSTSSRRLLLLADDYQARATRWCAGASWSPRAH